MFGIEITSSVIVHDEKIYHPVCFIICTVEQVCDLYRMFVKLNGSRPTLSSGIDLSWTIWLNKE